MTVAFTFPEDILSAVTREECERLAELAKDGLVLELGAQFGRSTFALASVAKVVHVVDWHKGDEFSGESDTFHQFQSNLQRYRLTKKVVSFVCRNEVILPALKGIFEYDLAFIDSYAAREAVEQDLRLVRPLVRAGGVIAVHDYGDVPGVPPGRFGVTEAVDGFVLQEGARLETVRTLAVIHLV